MSLKVDPKGKGYHLTLGQDDKRKFTDQPVNMTPMKRRMKDEAKKRRFGNPYYQRRKNNAPAFSTSLVFNPAAQPMINTLVKRQVRRQMPKRMYNKSNAFQPFERAFNTGLLINLLDDFRQGDSTNNFDGLGASPLWTKLSYTLQREPLGDLPLNNPIIPTDWYVPVYVALVQYKVPNANIATPAQIWQETGQDYSPFLFWKNDITKSFKVLYERFVVLSADNQRNFADTNEVHTNGSKLEDIKIDETGQSFRTGGMFLFIIAGVPPNVPTRGITLNYNFRMKFATQ